MVASLSLRSPQLNSFRCANPSMSLAALLFDVDGTLADTEAGGHRPAYNQAFAALDLDWHWSPELYRELLAVSGGVPRLNFFLDRYRPSLGHHTTAYRRDPSAWIAALHDEKARFFREQLIHGHVMLRPGIARLIEAARDAEIFIGLVSNASRATVDAVRDYCLGRELGDALAIIVTGDDTPRPKPDPGPYSLACARLGIAADEAVAIEDSSTGLRGAIAAGVPTLVTTSQETREQDFSGALAVIDSLDHPGRLESSTGFGGLSFEHVDLDVLLKLHAGTVKSAMDVEPR